MAHRLQSPATQIDIGTIFQLIEADF